MPETLPAVATKDLEAPLLASLTALQSKLDLLRRNYNPLQKEPVSKHVADVAAELYKECRALSNDVAASPLSKQIANANQMHKFLTGIRKKITDRIVGGIDFTHGITVRFTREEQARIAEAKRQLEEQALREEEERRLEEATHLEAQGEPEAAAELLDAPILTPVVAVPEAQKLDGASVSLYWELEDEPIVDTQALLAALLANPHHLQGVKIEVRLSYWKEWANHRSGTTAPVFPGLRFRQGGTTRSRKE